MDSVQKDWDKWKQQRNLFEISKLDKDVFCNEVRNNTNELSRVAFNTREKYTVNNINSFLSKYEVNTTPPSFAELWLPQKETTGDLYAKALGTRDPNDYMTVKFVGVVGIIQSILNIIKNLNENVISWNNKRLKYCNSLLRLFFIYALDKLIYIDAGMMRGYKTGYIIDSDAPPLGQPYTTLFETHINMLHSVMTKAYNLVIGSDVNREPTPGGKSRKSKKRNNKKSKSRKSCSTKRR
jgi:hypothetical protein